MRRLTIPGKQGRRSADPTARSGTTSRALAHRPAHPQPTSRNPSRRRRFTPRRSPRAPTKARGSLRREVVRGAGRANEDAKSALRERFGSADEPHANDFLICPTASATLRSTMKRIRLVSRAILGAFADMVYANRLRLHRLWLVAPWIGDDASGGALAVLLEALRERQASVIVVTRPPAQPWHAQAVEALRADGRATVYTSPNLHTKLYIAECNGFRGAMLGSANLTSPGDRKNLELAVEFRSTMESPTDEVAALLSELSRYASDLRQDDDVALA